MATTDNGWPASRYLKTRVIEPVKGCRLRVLDNNNVADVFTYLVQQYHKRVDDVTKPHPADDWGFDFRENANDPYHLSRHAGAIAIDLDATEHPNGVSTRKTFTTHQINEIHRILDELDHVVRWGGDYSHPDAMHFEINVRPGGLRAIGRKLRMKKRPSKPSLVTQFKASGEGHPYDLKLLDRAVANGRRGKVKDVRDDIVKAVHRLPNDRNPNTRISKFKKDFADDRLLRMGYLYNAIKDGRIGAVKSEYYTIKNLIHSLNS